MNTTQFVRQPRFDQFRQIILESIKLQQIMLLFIYLWLLELSKAKVLGNSEHGCVFLAVKALAEIPL